MKQESLEDFLKRGGEIKKCETPEYKSNHNSRYTEAEQRQAADFDRKDRLPGEMRKKGVFKHRLMTLKFRGYE